MTDDTPADHDHQAEWPLLLSPWIVSYFGWPLAGFASLAAYMLTGQAGLAIAALASGAIWPDLVASLWYARNDPVWRRRIGLPLAHLATGLTYSFVLALFLLLGATFADALVPWISLFSFVGRESVVIIMLVWAGLAALSSLLAVLWSLATRLTLWIDTRPLEQVLRGEWPPRRQTTNEAAVPIYVTLVGIIPLPFILGAWLGGPGTWLVTFGWLGTLLLIGLGLKFFFALKDLLVAEMPLECWPELLERDDE